LHNLMVVTVLVILSRDSHWNYTCSKY